MNNAKENLIKQLKLKANLREQDAIWHAGKVKEAENELADLKETIAQLESCDVGNLNKDVVKMNELQNMKQQAKKKSWWNQWRRK